MSYDADKQPAIIPPFWVVWCVEVGCPTKKHPEKWQACKEARRLAEKHPGKLFFVLQTTSYHQAEVTVRMCSTNMETTQP